MGERKRGKKKREWVSTSGIQQHVDPTTRRSWPTHTTRRKVSKGGSIREWGMLRVGKVNSKIKREEGGGGGGGGGNSGRGRILVI